MGEEHGIHYNFVSVEDMQAAINNKEFLETAVFSGNMYGTSIQAVKNVQQNGKVCVLDIEIEGVKQVRATDLNPVLVFIMPPSIEELERRLTGRKSETPETLKQRLETARREIDYGKCLLREICLFDICTKFSVGNFVCFMQKNWHLKKHCF